MSEPMEDKSLEKGRATEKDRVRKVVERAFNQMQFYGINVPDRIKNVEYFTRLILKEIKRAERREQDSIYKIVDALRFEMVECMKVLAKDGKSPIRFAHKADAFMKVLQTIRNRRNV